MMIPDITSKTNLIPALLFFALKGRVPVLVYAITLSVAMKTLKKTTHSPADVLVPILLFSFVDDPFLFILLCAFIKSLFPQLYQ